MPESTTPEAFFTSTRSVGRVARLRELWITKRKPSSTSSLSLYPPKPLRLWPVG